MFRRISKTKHKSRHAFTLVELIVVLVILAVLAAMLVPALTGYIKKAKKEKYYEEAHYALMACQSVITEVNAMDLDPNDFETTIDLDNVYWYKDNHNGRTGKDAAWGDKVLNLMDRERGTNEPYILIFGVGNFKDDAKTYCGIDSNKQSTVYYIAYVPTANSQAVFYVNGVWTYEYPKINDNSFIKEYTIGSTRFKNTIHRDPNGKKYAPADRIPLTFYVVSNQSGYDISDANFWKDTVPAGLKGHAEPYYKG